MRPTPVVTVYDQAGQTATLENEVTLGNPLGTAMNRAGGNVQALLRLADKQGVSVPTELLTPQPDGTVRFAGNFADFAAPVPTSFAHWVNLEGDKAVVPLVEEVVKISRRRVEQGVVRFIKTVQTEERTIDEPLLHETVEVQRVPVNQVVEAAPAARYEGETLIVPLLEEVLVVEKRLLVKEELHITRRRTVVHEPQTITLRREEMQVERTSGESSQTAAADVSPLANRQTI